MGSTGKEAIVFFDKLGFGWVVDGVLLKHIKLGLWKEDDIPNRSLIKIIENILSEKPLM